MAPKKRPQPQKRAANSWSQDPPAPFKLAPESLAPFYETLSTKHTYITHIDTKPRDFKRKIFIVPVLLNIGVVALFVLRVWYVAPYYLKLVETTIGHPNELTVNPSTMSWRELIFLMLRRGLTLLLDFCLTIFVWPWPVEFAFGRGGNPVSWRWSVGFRDREIYVRRSREWDMTVGDIIKDVDGRGVLLSMVRVGMSPLLVAQKTGYLLMNGEWDLAWGAMIKATELVDREVLALEDFTKLALVHHPEFGWMCIDLGDSPDGPVDERRRQVFAFRDALAAVGKDDLFYRWIEIIQFEASQVGGFTPERQAEVATQVRDLFHEQGIHFDAFWKESVGSDGLADGPGGP